MNKNMVKVKLPNSYTGTLVGYEFNNGEATVLETDAQKFHWRIVPEEPKAKESTKPEPVEVTLDNLDDAEYIALKAFYNANKDEEGFPECENREKETLRDAIREFLTPEDENEDEEPDGD